jgi:hypothetical protein
LASLCSQEAQTRQDRVLGALAAGNLPAISRFFGQRGPDGGRGGQHVRAASSMWDALSVCGTGVRHVGARSGAASGDRRAALTLASDNGRQVDDAERHTNGAREPAISAGQHANREAPRAGGGGERALHAGGGGEGALPAGGGEGRASGERVEAVARVWALGVGGGWRD